jgi:POT family proton-dependent oligopeptide transporter
MTEEKQSAESTTAAAGVKPNPFQEIVQPFVDVWHAPRALWGVNLGYMLEGLAYFGVLGYLAIYFSQEVFAGVPNPDTYAHNMVAVLTGGITIAMLFLGFVPDKWGVRRALIWSFVLLIIGRVLIAAAPTLLHLPAGLGSPLHLATMAGILIVVVGYGMYQPAAYAAVRQFTTPRTSGMAYAMLYALMNLGGWIPSFAFLLRDGATVTIPLSWLHDGLKLQVPEVFSTFVGLRLGITGTFWFYVGITVLGLVSTLVLLTSGTVAKAIAKAKADSVHEQGEAEKAGEKPVEAAVGTSGRYPPAQMWLLMLGVAVAFYFRVPATAVTGLPVALGLNLVVALLVVVLWIGLALLPASGRFLARHPLADLKFFFFIFALIPVQTLFTYNWLVLPEYISRAYTGWVGEKFEIASNFNPILIFILTPIIAALTLKRSVYNMMIWGTFIMAAPAFLLVLGPSPWTLFAYLVIMTVGEAMWSPRFLQYAAEIAPEGRTGEYMGVAQLPWFLTKVLVPLLYSGTMMDRYCPAPQTGRAVHTEPMWLIFGIIAMGSFVLLVLAKNWIGKDFKTKAA